MTEILKVQSVVHSPKSIANHSRLYGLWTIVYGLLVLTAPVLADDDVPQGIMSDPIAESMEASAASPEAVSEDAAATEAAPAALSQAERLRTIVDLSFTNANLRNVLSGLAKSYGLNIVAGEEIAGTVNLTLRQVTLDEGLRQMLKLNGFEFQVSEEIIAVTKAEEKRVADVLHLKYLVPDTALEFIQPLASEGAILKIDEPTSSILIHDYEKKIQDMRATLEIVDQPPQQVLIDSRLIDITHTDLDNLGLSFSSLTATIPLHAAAGAGESSLPLSLSSGSYNLGSLLSSGTARTSHEATFTLARGSTDSTIANLDALIQNQRVKVLANPSVLTINNVEAKINIGEKFPIREQTQTSTGTLETTRFVDVGTNLRVTPRINREGFIQMHIHPEVSSVSSTLDAGPRITTREADVTVLVKDGQPVVIAGLLSEEETGITQRVPGLGHIPVLGLLFQNRTKDHEQKELVIMITPYVTDIARPGKLEPEVDKTAERLDVLELFSEGMAMEDNRTLKARRLPEMLRYHEAVQLYQRLVERFPTHPYAAEALWRIGHLSKERLHNMDQAELAFHRLITRFPANPYEDRARKQLQTIRKGQARRAKMIKMTARSLDIP